MRKHILLLGFALGTAPALHAQKPIGELFAGDANVLGTVSLSGNGTHVLSGSQISAGDGAARLRLTRGGELRICPKTNLSLSADANGKSLVLGLNVGSMELNYTLPSATDSLLTPDFRLQLISPGTFHLAISVAGSGDTCVRTLPGNDAAVFVAEMMGGDSYQLTPGKSVMFKGGKISGATDAPVACGCPEIKPETRALEFASAPPATAPAQAPAAPAAADHGASHMKVEGSFVFRGEEHPEDYYTTVAKLSTSKDNSQLTMSLLPQVSAPAAAKPAEKKRGLLRRFGNALGRLFRN